MYVYLLKHKNEPIFKIGKANDIHARLPEIGGLESYDLPASKALNIGEPTLALRVEKTLHRLFMAWSADDLGSFEGNSGHTEMFKTECFDRVVQFVQENGDLLGGLPIPTEIPSAPTPANPEEILSKAEKKALRRQERASLIQSQNENTFHHIKTAVDGWLAREQVLGGDANEPMVLYFKKGAITRADMFESMSGHDGLMFETEKWSGGFRIYQDLESHSHGIVAMQFLLGKRDLEYDQVPFLREIEECITSIPMISQEDAAKALGVMVSELPRVYDSKSRDFWDRRLWN